MKIKKKIAPAYEDFIFNWDYETYLLVGGYGSGKSYHIAFKIILKLLEEKRVCLVVREVFDTILESCYSLFSEILQDMGLFTEDRKLFGKNKNRVLAVKSPIQFKFPNGSRIIFKGMDKPEKVKSINGVSIVWVEEASEVKYEGYQELLGRIRTPKSSMHFILSCNPVGRENWIYRHFFTRLSDDGVEKVIMPENKFYDLKVCVKNGVYYHHSTPSDNPWLPKPYLARLDRMRTYDYPRYMVARLGQFGVAGNRVLPQLKVQLDSAIVDRAVERLGPENQYFGFDFGFEESYNALLYMSVDSVKGYLYVWDEIYVNHLTDPEFAALPKMQELRDYLDSINDQGYNKMIVADNEDPKAIQYYRQSGFKMRGCFNKFAGSRLSNTRKMKRFHKIIVAGRCKNTIRELRDLTYAKDAKGNIIYDKFVIDPHTFSAMWYGLDTVTVADVKDKEFYSKG